MMSKDWEWIDTDPGFVSRLEADLEQQRISLEAHGHIRKWVLGLYPLIAEAHKV